MGMYVYRYKYQLLPVFICYHGLSCMFIRYHCLSLFIIVHHMLCYNILSRIIISYKYYHTVSCFDIYIYIYIYKFINIYIYIMYYHMLSYVIIFDHMFIMFYHMLSYLIIRLLLFIICHHILLCVYHMFIMCLSCVYQRLSYVIIVHHILSFILRSLYSMVCHHVPWHCVMFQWVSVGQGERISPAWATVHQPGFSWKLFMKSWSGGYVWIVLGLLLPNSSIRDARFLDPSDMAFPVFFPVIFALQPWTAGWGGAWLHRAMFPHKPCRRSGLHRRVCRWTWNPFGSIVQRKGKRHIRLLLWENLSERMGTFIFGSLLFSQWNRTTYCKSRNLSIWMHLVMRLNHDPNTRVEWLT